MAIKRVLVILTILAITSLCLSKEIEPANALRTFRKPMPVTIRGYNGDAMEPFVSRDGHYLFFNNRNDPAINTNLYYAERIDELTFQYKGEVAGINTSALEGVATMDLANNFYFVSTRSYDQTFSTIYRGKFENGQVSNIELVSGISTQQPGMVNFDVEVSPEGETLYYVESRFGSKGPETADIAIAQRHGSMFMRAANSDYLMQQINTEALEYAASISADGLTLFFTRAPQDLSGTAIFMAKRTSLALPFNRPTRLTAIKGFVEAPTLSPDERSLYYHKKVGNQFMLYRVSR